MIAKRKIVKCDVCDSYFDLSDGAIYKAIKKHRKILCSKCKDAKKLIGISLEDAIKIKGNKLWKGKVKFTCKICNENTEYEYCKLAKRKYGKLEPICKKCILKYATNTEEWKNKNSAAQLIAQNKPEQKIKNSLAVREACKRPDVIKRKSEAMKKAYANSEEYRMKNIEHLRKIWTNQKSLEKQQLWNRFTSGYVVIENEPLFFNSGWELVYIRYCVENKIPIKRCKEQIPYMYKGKNRLYYPDFVIEKDGKKIIVEIKGRYNGSSELVYPKMEAAIKFIKTTNKYDDYVIYFKEELIKIGLDLSTANIKELKNEADKSYEDYKKTLQREGLRPESERCS